jgi:hypothetical protein
MIVVFICNETESEMMVLFSGELAMIQVINDTQVIISISLTR